MRKLLKRWYFWLVLCLLLGLAAGGTLILSGRSRINQANCDRIEIGMTIDQVTEILGPRKIHYVGGGIISLHIWMDGRDTITVTTDPMSKRVRTKAYNDPTAWARLRWHANALLFKLGLSDES
jgi:hypothetical protein